MNNLTVINIILKFEVRQSHIGSVPKRHEPLNSELDDARIFQHLDALGYQGFVGCEYRPANGTVAGLGWRDRLR